jgi:pyruvate/2-oxoglutarate dehydrogenase complex dihydrolipoamide acyltransferase (E2) component
MTSTEMRFIAWLVTPGQEFASGDELFEVEADKATVVCEAERSGVLAETLAQEGAAVREGEVLGYFDAR